MTYRVSSFGLALLLAAIAAHVQCADGPTVDTRRGIAYISGGVGEAEAEQLKAREKEFNLKLVFTLVEGNYVAGINVMVKDARGTTVVEHVTDGPLFMARLPAVAATFRNRTQTLKVSVGGRLRIGTTDGGVILSSTFRLLRTLSANA